ncbi:MAG TPA: carboxypeptidase regulatory-like domain-containing protein [Bryobacteraceae bacterium]|nr:carboxypeptidase regulatory-like domain-containing protein [Bryobacteraceae bacterium]
MKTIANFFAALTLAGGCLWGQAITTAQIQGTVTDATGLAVAGAEVRATQTGTGAVRTTTSGADGGYVLTNLPVGPYRLEVSKQGFTKFVQTGIVLQVNSNPKIDAALKVGAVSETVEVQANAAMVETQSNGVGQVVDQQRVVDLPLNGRNVTDLITLTGGASTPTQGGRSSYPSSAAVSITGGGIGTVAYMLDGGTNNDPLSNQNLPLPFPDALQEFKVETSSLPAQYGYHSAGAVNAVTKSGTNEVHGDAFEFVRNYLFNARNSFQPVRDTLKRNQFGGTLGGPIVKDKLFFFLGYQDTIVRSTPAATVAFVPTPAMLAGDFSAVAGPPCRATPLVLPASLGFVNNRISPSAFSPVALSLAKYLPTTSNPCGQITYATPASFTENQGLAKVDYQLTTKNSLFGRYFVTHLEQPAGSPSGNILVQSIGGASDNVFNATLGDTYLIKPNMVSSFRLMANRSSNTNVYNSYFGLPDLGVSGVYQLPASQFGKYLGGWTVGGSGGAGGFNIGTTPSSQPYLTWQASEDVSLTHGAHQISFGVLFINLKATAINYLASNGNFSFNGQFSGIPNADFLLGMASSFQQAGPAYSDQHQNIFGTYIQDSWKVSRRITINAGIRWDPFFAHTNPYNETETFSLANFANGVVSTKFPNAPAGLVFGGDPQLPNNQYSNNKLANFSPRVGIVLDPKGDGRMTIRAGYGIFYDFPSFAFDQFGFSPPWGANLTVPNPPSLTNPWANFAGGNPFPLQPPQNFVFPQGNAQLTYGYPLDLKPTYIEQYNLSIEKQLGSNWMVSASYVGNVTRHLWLNNPVNQSQFLGIGPCTIAGKSYTQAQCDSPATTSQRRRLNFVNPTWGPYYGETEVLDVGGNGSYNGLILSLQHRFGRNFTSTTNYTWSHCISDFYTPALGLFLYSETQYNNRAADRGPCQYADRRQVFNQTLVVTSPKYGSHFVQAVAGNWNLSVSALAETGPPLNVTTVLDQALNSNGLVQRANQVLPDPYVANPGPAGWLNPKAFSLPALGTYGNLGAGAIRGPGAFVLNMALWRAFPITEHQRIEIRGEAFNLPNWTNPYNPVTTLVSPNFGQIVSAAPGGLGALILSTPNDPRILQFAVKYIF